MFSNISLSKKITLDFICSGIFMIIAGTLFMLNTKHDSIIFKILLLVAFIVAGLLKLLARFMDENDGDEMSTSHFRIVKASVYGNIFGSIVLFGIIGAIADFFNYALFSNWYAWFLVTLGCEELFAAKDFYNLERNGD